MQNYKAVIKNGIKQWFYYLLDLLTIMMEHFKHQINQEDLGVNQHKILKYLIKNYIIELLNVN